VGDANGFSLEFVDPSAPLVPNGQAVFASDSSAQAEFNSLGQSQAFASVPYPGPVVSTLPNLVNGFTSGQFPPLPTYPLYTSSEYPTTPSDSVTQGPYAMNAKSGANGSTATSTIGASTTPSVAEIASSADATQKTDGSVLADASTKVDGLDFGAGSLLEIDGVQTTAMASRAPGGALHTLSNLSVAKISIANVGLTLSDKGLAVAGLSVPLSGAAPMLTALLSELKASGITVAYLPAKQLSDGVQSAALVISEQQNVPGQGEVVATITVGGVIATIDSSVIPFIQGSTDSGLSGSNLPSSLGASGFSASSSLPISSPIGSPTPATTAAQGPPKATSGEIIEFIRKALALKGSASDFYLVIVAAALFALICTELFRRLGIQLRFSGHSRK
jgi:hypothetical protein